MDHLTIARSPEIRKLSPAEPKMSYERLDCLSFAANFEGCGRNPCARHTGNVLRLSASKKKKQAPDPKEGTKLCQQPKEQEPDSPLSF